MSGDTFVFSRGCCMGHETVAQLKLHAARQTQRRSVLIIEDDEAQALALSRRLDNQGYNVLVAQTGREGLDLAKRRHPNVIVMDLNLPDMEGFEIAAAVSDDVELCGTAIIMLSGMDGPDIVRRSRAAGCQYFVRKPYDPNALLILIEHSLANEQEEAWAM